MRFSFSFLLLLSSLAFSLPPNNNDPFSDTANLLNDGDFEVIQLSSSHLKSNASVTVPPEAVPPEAVTMNPESTRRSQRDRPPPYTREDVIIFIPSERSVEPTSYSDLGNRHCSLVHASACIIVSMVVILVFGIVYGVNFQRGMDNIHYEDGYYGGDAIPRPPPQKSSILRPLPSFLSDQDE